MYLTELTADRTPIGLCGLVKRSYLSGPDIGFAYLPQFWGSGYAFEGAAAIMRYSNSGLGLARLLAIVKSDNVRSVMIGTGTDSGSCGKASAVSRLLMNS